MLDALVVLKEALVVDCAMFAVRDADVLDEVAPCILDVAEVDRHVENVHRVAVCQQFSEVSFYWEVVAMKSALFVRLQDTCLEELSVQSGSPIWTIEPFADSGVVEVSAESEADVSGEFLFPCRIPFLTCQTI